ncbi:hypothetical protein J4H54_10595 [Vibrio alginolyticus]|uniref:hypothetical protein n=1 Tax=Vibrio alginolyticus TaxID=663 RepID=UPI001BD5EEDE|nr:hypothetical protein [Vibrio alginolyticus]
MDDLAAVWLNKQLLNNLEKLEEIAKFEGKKLTQKKSRDGISVLDAFDVPLEELVAEVLAKDIPFLVSFIGKRPRTIQEFIRFSGGLSTCIEKLIDYRVYYPVNSKRARLQDQESAIIDYVDVIEQMLVKAKGKTPQKPSSDKMEKDYTAMPLPFCALCFRRVNQSHYYCKEHHSSRNSIVYKQATRRLMSAVYRHSSDSDEQAKLEKHKRGEQKLDAKTLYRWMDLFSTPSTLAITDLNKLDQGADGWQAFAKCILVFTVEHYPYTSKKLPEMVNGSNFDDWIIKIVKLLGGQVEANMWKHKDSGVWMINSNLMQKALTILNCLSRYEAMCVVESYEVKTGSKSGSKVDSSKHEIAYRLLKEKETDDSITVSLIAKESSLSRAAIYKIMKKDN